MIDFVLVLPITGMRANTLRAEQKIDHDCQGLAYIALYGVKTGELYKNSFGKR